MNTLYWYDYETFGLDPKSDRIVQFAGVRTDEDLNIVGEPLMLYCKPANDVLPNPESCLITGITPQLALEKGVIEAEFIEQINQVFSEPGTCVVGYNSIRFDDEFTRYSLYRNFLDPYAREWQNGNSRWDLLDVVRLTRALRPEGIEWPFYTEGEREGRPSYRLEDLAVANGIAHESAHDALSDVYATIAMARLIKEKQPKLYDYAYTHRQKRKLTELLNIQKQTPVIHISGMYPPEFGCAAVVVPVAAHPVNKNAIIVFDLRYDPTPLMTLSKEEIGKRLFTPADELPDGVERMPLKTVTVNKCPVIVPMNTLDGAAAKRLKIDITVAMTHLHSLTVDRKLSQKIQNVFSAKVFEQSHDPDHSLYGGGFFNTDDKARMERIRAEKPESLAGLKMNFDDERIPEMLFRYRARNYYETLTAEEKQRWEKYRVARFTSPDGGAGITLDAYFEKISEFRKDEKVMARSAALLDDLAAYGEKLRDL